MEVRRYIHADLVAMMGAPDKGRELHAGGRKLG